MVGFTLAENVILFSSPWYIYVFYLLIHVVVFNFITQIVYQIKKDNHVTCTEFCTTTISAQLEKQQQQF